MFENVDGRTDDGVIGIIIAHLGAFGSGELLMDELWVKPGKLCTNLHFPGFTHILRKIQLHQ